MDQFQEEQIIIGSFSVSILRRLNRSTRFFLFLSIFDTFLKSFLYLREMYA